MRDCGDCTLCCKLPAIKDFKVGYKWCEHCNIGKGCNIYETRPKPCIDFNCIWKDERTNIELKPNKVGFYITDEGDPNNLTLFTEEYKLKSIVPHLKRNQFYNKKDECMGFVIRYNDNPNDVAYYNYAMDPEWISFHKRDFKQ
jgi:hypothetical protein